MKDVLELLVNADCCHNCVYCILRPDMKNVWYCVKNNFAVLNLDQKCDKFIRSKLEDEIRRN